MAALVALLVLGLALASRAEAYIYWANAGTSSIGRANLDGTGVNTSFIRTGGYVVGIAVDGAHIYWSYPGQARRIGRANLDGSGQNNNFMTNICNTCGIGGLTVDRAHLYWFEDNSYIGRANLDGSGQNKSFIHTDSNPQYLSGGVAVDSAHIYWVNPTHYIGRANLDGTGVNQQFVAGSICNAVDLAVDAHYVYWAEGDFCGRGGLIGRAYLDGSRFGNSGLGQLGPTLRLPYWLAVDGGHAYWSVLQGTTIGRMNLDGSGTNQSFISGLSDTNEVAVDAGGPPVVTLTVARRQRLTRTLANGVRLRLASSATGRACAELRLKARTARRLGLRPKRSERRLGKRVGRRRCLKLTANRPRKLAVRFSRRSRQALTKLVRRYGPRRLAGLRRLVRRKGLSVRVRVVFTDTKGHRYTRSRPLRLVR